MEVRSKTLSVSASTTTSSTSLKLEPEAVLVRGVVTVRSAPAATELLWSGLTVYPSIITGMSASIDPDR
ncbi:hypothetical protein [Salinigranum halophilum]|uniref:hypothetical protein n=1 Tax=Salinigranum halophilum TaxID=2565931 RepID=UPI0010A8DABF|nr:hypothetical protein [Salinigranum halophilum]